MFIIINWSSFAALNIIHKGEELDTAPPFITLIFAYFKDLSTDQRKILKTFQSQIDMKM